MIPGLASLSREKSRQMQTRSKKLPRSSESLASQSCRAIWGCKANKNHPDTSNPDGFVQQEEQDQEEASVLALT